MLIYFSLKYTLIFCLITLIIGRFFKAKKWQAKILDILFLGTGRMLYRDYVIGLLSLIGAVIIIQSIRFMGGLINELILGEVLISISIIVIVFYISILAFYGEKDNQSIQKVRAGMKNDMNNSNKSIIKNRVKLREKDINSPIMNAGRGVSIPLIKNKIDSTFPLDDDDLYEQEIDRHIKLKLAYKKLGKNYDGKLHESEAKSFNQNDSGNVFEEFDVVFPTKKENKELINIEEWEEENERFERQRRIDHEILEMQERDHENHEYHSEMYDEQDDFHNDLQEDLIDDFVQDHMNDYH